MVHTSLQKGRLKVLGTIFILSIGGIHIFDARESFQDAAYKGWLFYANGMASCLAAYWMNSKMSLWGWGLGFLVAAASFMGYVASRTIGLPMIPPEPDNWLEPLGVASLILEALFIVIVLLPRRTHPGRSYLGPS